MCIRDRVRKTKRVKKGGGEDAFAFADASLFEEEVEAIVNHQKDLERGAQGTITGGEARVLAGHKGEKASSGGLRRKAN